MASILRSHGDMHPRCRVLIIDDHLPSREAVTQAVTAMGGVVVEEGCGLERGVVSFDQVVAEALPGLVRDLLARDQDKLYRRVMDRVERPLLALILEATGGNQLKAASLLGINRNTLRKRLRLLGLAAPRQRRTAVA